MAEAVGGAAEADVLFDPGLVAPLGAVGIVFGPEEVADLVEELHGVPPGAAFVGGGRTA